MCHLFLSHTRFYRLLFRLDRELASDVQASGCRYCGGALHSARYPRKPRGLRAALDQTYDTRLSFCCAVDGCRRRNTPPSVRFLGRKVYLGAIVILLTALQHGLSDKRRRELAERLDIPSQTVARWRSWWRDEFAGSRCWQAERGHFMPPIPVRQLPDALLERLTGRTLLRRLWQLLRLIQPVTTAWSASVREQPAPQTM